MAPVTPLGPKHALNNVPDILLGVAEVVQLKIEPFEYADEIPNPDEPVDEKVFQKLARESLTVVLSKLPKTQRHAAFLAWVAGYPITSSDGHSISRIMDISETAVHKHLRNAKARLAGMDELKKLFRSD